MAQAPPRWTWWRSLVSPLTAVCTRPGWVRFVPWGTGRGRGWEAPPIPQLWTALGLEACWRGLAHVAEEGAGAREAGERPPSDGWSRNDRRGGAGITLSPLMRPHGTGRGRRGGPRHVSGGERPQPPSCRDRAGAALGREGGWAARPARALAAAGRPYVRSAPPGACWGDVPPPEAAGGGGMAPRGRRVACAERGREGGRRCRAHRCRRVCGACGGPAAPRDHPPGGARRPGGRLRGARGGGPGPPAAVPRGRPWTAAPWAWLRGGHGGRPGAMGPGHHCTRSRPVALTMRRVVRSC